MRRETYRKEIGLQDNEIPARKDLETGTYTDIPVGRKRVLNIKSLHFIQGKYCRR